MPRKKTVVEGLVLDLTGIEGVAVDVTAIVAAEKAEKAAAIERKKAEKAAAAAVARAKKKEEAAASDAIAKEKKKEKNALANYNKMMKMIKESTFDGIAYIQSISTNKCVDCPTQVLFNDRCSPCYKIHIEAKNKRIMGYVYSKGMNKCNFCGAPRKDDYCTGFHFDHLNMFMKTGNVGQMIRYDVDDLKIMEEIDKCQLLCISCHSIVTKIEMKCGFTQQKIKLNKGFGNREELVAEYDRVMGPVYEEIKEKFRGVGGDGREI